VTISYHYKFDRHEIVTLIFRSVLCCLYYEE